MSDETAQDPLSAERTAVLEKALTALGGFTDYEQPDLLRLLAPVMTTAALTRALEIAKALDQHNRAAAIVSLVRYLPPHLLAEALSYVRAIESPWSRGWALWDMAPYVGKELQAEALPLLWAEDSETEYLEATAELGPKLTTDQMAFTLDFIRKLNGDREWSGVVGGMGKYLPHTLLLEAFADAQVSDDLEVKLDLLTAVVRHAPDLRVQALEVVRSLPFDSAAQRLAALRALVPHLPGDLLAQLLIATREIEDPWDRVRHTMELLPNAEGELRATLIAEILIFARTSAGLSRAKALQHLAKHLRDEARMPVLGEMLAIAETVKNEHDRACVLTNVLPLLSPQLVGKALNLVRAFSDPAERAPLLARFLPHTTPKQRDRIQRDVLKALSKLFKTERWSHVLWDVAPFLTPEMLATFVPLLGASDQRRRYETIRVLARWLPPALLPYALNAAVAFQDERSRAGALHELGPYLPPEMLIDALAAVQTIAEPQSWHYAVKGLARHVQPMQLAEALAARHTASILPG